MLPASNNKRTAYQVAVLVGIALLLLGSYLVLRQMRKTPEAQPPVSQTSERPINYSPSTTQEKEEGEKNKLGESDGTKPASKPTQSTVTISNIWQAANKDIIVQTELHGSGWAKCSLTLTRYGASPITASAEVLYQPEVSSCQGFAIPITQFKIGGEWTAALTVSALNGSTSSSAPKTINIVK